MVWMKYLSIVFVMIAFEIFLISLSLPYQLYVVFFICDL